MPPKSKWIHKLNKNTLDVHSLEIILLESRVKNLAVFIVEKVHSSDQSDLNAQCRNYGFPSHK